MNMKRYRAETMVEAMKKVRADFGEDAVILSSTVHQSKGFLGLFKKKSVEVVAGYDRPPIKSPVQKPIVSSVQTEELQQEMVEMRKILKELSTTKKNIEFDRYPQEMQPLLNLLHKQELAESTIAFIADAIFTEMKEKKEDFSLQQQIALAKELLFEQVKELPFGGITFKKSYINVLGPTGVGKTTTIAKIAARSMLENKSKVGFITTDTYRIAAIEQLRTYANLLQAPVEVVYNAEDFTQAIDALGQLDLVFIDTAGRNYKETKFVEDLRELVDFTLDMQSFLVLSATSKQQDMQAIIEQFSTFPIDQFIFTKVDETSSIGPLFNLAIAHQKGIAYITDGQEVPEDITAASFDSLFQLLVGELTNA